MLDVFCQARDGRQAEEILARGVGAAEHAEIFEPEKGERLGEVRAQRRGEIGHVGEGRDALFVEPAEDLRSAILRLSARGESGFDLGEIEALDGWFFRGDGHGRPMAQDATDAKD